jgi:chemotaxis protein methyltransferase CheR
LSAPTACFDFARGANVTLLSCNALTPDEYSRLSDAVCEHCGINLHQGKKKLVDARLSRLLRTSRFHSAAEYIDYVVNHPESNEFYGLIDTICTNVTNFFREMSHFDYLAKVLTPALWNKKQRTGQQTGIRGWSAACSSGEEAYSIAIQLLESLPKPTPISVKLLATDISNNMLTKACQGLYASDLLATVPGPLKRRYFVASAGEREICYRPIDAVRKIVRFAYLNLMEPWPFNGPFDFIFCRNVMIYFDKRIQQKLVNRFYDVLDDGGTLFIGHAESLAGISHKFRYVRPTIYVKA